MEKSELLRQYRELDRDCARLSYRLAGGREGERELFIPDETNRNDAWNTWRELKERTEALEEPDGVFSLVKHHFEDFLDSLEYAVEDAGKHPENAFLHIRWMLESLSRTSRKPDEERCEGLVSWLDVLCKARGQFLPLLSKRDGKELLQVSHALYRESLELEAACQKLGEYFPTFTEEQKSRAREALVSFGGMLREMADGLPKGKEPDAGTKSAEDRNPKAEEDDPGITVKTEEDDLGITVKMEEEDYRTLLGKKLGVSLDELLAWRQDEVEKTRSEVFEIASRLDIPEDAPKTMGEVNEILFKYEGPCDSPEEMFARADAYLERTRVLAHEYVKLPEDESCVCVGVPDSCKDSYPWGGYEGGDFTVRPLKGQMFLNHHNYRNVTDGWIKLNSLHEAYPGHHVQYVRAAVDETPETVKIGAKLVPLLEGTCLRTERAFESVFSEDPFFPLFVAYRRHHASVRICVDLMLFYGGATLEEAVRMYERELGFERGTARKQVRAHQNMPGYFTCYYYGMKKLSGWEKEYGFSKKDFTELLFSAGYISIERFGELARLAPEERERYFHEFSSLMREEKEGKD